MNEFLVQCEKLDHQGRGITKINGKIVFVDNLLPNEKAIIEITNDKNKFSEGKIIELIKKNSNRIKPICPYLNCGCTLKHLEYNEQLKYKEDKIKELLKKLNTQIKPIIPSEKINNYRNKITLKVNNYVGYHKNRSNNFFPIKRCELVSGKVNKIIEVLNSEDLNSVKEIIIKEFDEIMIIIKGKMKINNLKKLAHSIYLNDDLNYGKEYITTKLNFFDFKISKDSFFQINKNQTINLYNKIIDYLKEDKNKIVLDLYSGTGTISLFLSKYFKEVIGIEINKEAIKSANENKKLNNIKNVRFIKGDVSKEIKRLKADIIIVDPPRAGLTKEGIKDILKIDPEKIVYVSCNPITLARDLNLLKEKYNIIEVTPIDMFPNTHHVETVTLLKSK